MAHRILVAGGVGIWRLYVLLLLMQSNLFYGLVTLLVIGDLFGLSLVLVTIGVISMLTILPCMYQLQ